MTDLKIRGVYLYVSSNKTSRICSGLQLLSNTKPDFLVRKEKGDRNVAGKKRSGKSLKVLSKGICMSIDE